MGFLRMEGLYITNLRPQQHHRRKTIEIDKTDTRLWPIWALHIQQGVSSVAGRDHGHACQLESRHDTKDAALSGKGTNEAMVIGDGPTYLPLPIQSTVQPLLSSELHYRLSVQPNPRPDRLTSCFQPFYDDVPYDVSSPYLLCSYWPFRCPSS